MGSPRTSMTHAWIVDDDDEMSHAVLLMLRMLDIQVEVYREARARPERCSPGASRTCSSWTSTCRRSAASTCSSSCAARNSWGLPVVMLSSETTDVQVDEALAKGANAFVFKPVTLEELEAAVRKATGG